MKNLMFKIAVATSVAIGAQSVFAQEMGEEESAVVAEEASTTEESTEATEEPAEATAEESEPSPEQVISDLSEKDDGAKIVEDSQDTAPAEIVPKDARGAMVAWVAKEGLEEGFSSERGYILQIGVASDNSTDPQDEDFQTKREALYREATLRAKVDIAGLVQRQVTASNHKRGLSQDDLKRFERENAKAINDLNEANLKLAKLMVAMDVAETKQLKGVTTGDRLNKLIDSAIKKLDRNYNAEQIAAEKLAQYECVKKAYLEAKAQAEYLENKKLEMFPSQVMEANMQSLVELRLHGAIPLHQIESYVNGQFQIAVALIWSPKLSARASDMIAGRQIEKGSSTEDSTLSEYLRDNAESLAAMVGARQFVDKNGKVYFFAVASQEVSSDAVENDENCQFADMMAMHAVATSLYTEGKGVSSANLKLAKRKGKSGDVGKALSENIDESTPEDIPLSGLGRVFSTEQVYPITQKTIYISVAAIDADLAAKAPALKKAWDVAAVDTIRTVNEKKGEIAGANEALEEAKKSKEDFERGRAKAKHEIKKEVKKVRDARKGVKVQEVQKKPAASKGAVQEGIFSGKAKRSNDF